MIIEDYWSAKYTIYTANTIPEIIHSFQATYEHEHYRGTWSMANDILNKTAIHDK